ncbi:MAG: hypothetical protein OK454_12395, partial [Thaumarchaeota archaeon]|nr:hypothetical protein [Nitrososphaerota archaeon]
MTKLAAQLEALAEAFASQVLASIRGASLDEILAESGRAKRGPGRPPGRSSRSKGDTVAAIVAEVGKHPKGVKGEIVRASLRLSKNAWLYAVTKALAVKEIRKTGKKRATR